MTETTPPPPSDPPAFHRSPHQPPTPGSARGLRFILIGALLLVLIIVGLIITSILTARDRDPNAVEPLPTETSGMTESPTPSAPPTTPSPTVDPEFGAPVADTVPNDGTAAFGDGVTAHIAAQASITATGTVPGEVSGPAVQLDLELTNGTSSALDLTSVTVNVFYGPDRTPASPYHQPREEAFPASLAAGSSATARFVFNVPKDAQSSLVITVSTTPGGPLVVFR